MCGPTQSLGRARAGEEERVVVLVALARRLGDVVLPLRDAVLGGGLAQRLAHVAGGEAAGQRRRAPRSVRSTRPGRRNGRLGGGLEGLGREARGACSRRRRARRPPARWPAALSGSATTRAVGAPRRPRRRRAPAAGSARRSCGGPARARRAGAPCGRAARRAPAGWRPASASARSISSNNSPSAGGASAAAAAAARSSATSASSAATRACARVALAAPPRRAAASAAARASSASSRLARATSSRRLSSGIFLASLLELGRRAARAPSRAPRASRARPSAFSTTTPKIASSMPDSSSILSHDPKTASTSSAVGQPRSGSKSSGSGA